MWGNVGYFPGTSKLALWQKTPEIRGFHGNHGYCLELGMAEGVEIELTSPRRAAVYCNLLIHEAQQGCRDATYEPSRFPVAVPYPSPHRATPAYVVVTSSDLDTSRNKASVGGLSWISRYCNIYFPDLATHPLYTRSGEHRGHGAQNVSCPLAGHFARE